MCAAIIFGFGSIMLPAIAWLIINQEWSFFIPLINVTYKPWRLFMVVCAVPGLVCGLALFKLPESPKYLLSAGREDETLEILKDIYSMNTGNDRESFPVSQVLKDIDIAMLPKAAIDKSSPVTSLLRAMWEQTVPLFSREYIRITLLVCLIQFIIFSTSNGMYMWFPDILNSVMKFESTNKGQSAYIWFTLCACGTAGIATVDNCEVSFYACGATLIAAGFLAFLVPKPITGNVEAPKRISLVSVVSMNSMVGRN
uniref:Major facilitator superfamily (MFS) profile domain-containing protein n=1 Tax=Megaselia scalaris TaxID=36166 RepID=T1GFD6_MEGSC